jgi:SAM-dependent methyltransferase
LDIVRVEGRSVKHPYMQEDDNVAENARLSSVRYEQTLSFIGDKLSGKCLDIGANNPFTQEMRKHLNVEIDNTEGDLDETELHGEYDVVFCFEVIEHLFNPLFHLRQVNKVLKPGGRAFISTPRNRPRFLWFEHHFHEMYLKNLLDLVHYAGFRVERQELIRVHPWWFYFTGIRPFFRMFFDRVWIMELHKV